MEEEDEDTSEPAIPETQDLFLIMEQVPSFQDVSQSGTNPGESTFAGPAVSSVRSPPLPESAHLTQIHRQKHTRGEIFHWQMNCMYSLMEDLCKEWQDRIAEWQERAAKEQLT